jgi:glycosyltransferase involved in cell wall biosynthesis
VYSLAEHHDLWVIVEEEKFRKDIELWQRSGDPRQSSITFHFIAKRRRRFLRRIWPPSYYWSYRQWHRDALALARRLHEEVQFDLAHQLTMVGFREPGYLWKLKLPFVWGPVGGMGYFPPSFLSEVGPYGACYYVGYNLYNWLQLHFLRRPVLAARRAGLGLIFATDENRRYSEKHWKTDGTVLAEVGVQSTLEEPLSRRAPTEPLRLVWSGEHIPRKALNLGIRALAALPVDVHWELDVLGTGPRTAVWQAMARRLGLTHRCHFHGRVPRAAALDIMKRAHAMLITSLRDLTSTVTVEALALGLPVVCPDHCGFSNAVTETSGFRVRARNPREMISGITSALIALYRDEALRLRLAHGALERARDFLWTSKTSVLATIYDHRISSERFANRGDPTDS